MAQELNKKDKLILVTGAAGLIGSAVLDQLKNKPGIRVVAVDQNTPISLKGRVIRFIKADLTESSNWDKLNKINFHCLIHAAAKIPKSFSDAKETGEAASINKRMDRMAIAAVRKKRACLIYFSTANLYKNTANAILDEQSGLRLTNAYAIEKRASEKLIVRNLRGFRYFIFRISAPFGQWQRHTTVIKSFAEKALRQKRILYLGSGNRRQDFIYSKDIARACLKALQSKHSGIYNLASGSSISMLELASLIKKLSHSKSQLSPACIPDPQENYRPAYRISLIKKHLGWSPQYSLKKSLTEYIKFLRKNNGYRHTL